MSNVLQLSDHILAKISGGDTEATMTVTTLRGRIERLLSTDATPPAVFKDMMIYFVSQAILLKDDGIKILREFQINQQYWRSPKSSQPSYQLYNFLD